MSDNGAIAHGKLGKLDPDHRRPALLFAHAISTPAPIPPSVNYGANVPSFPMLGNDQRGDCVEATMGHATESWTYDAQRTEAPVTDTDVLGAYSKITGFDPSQDQPDGSNSTDQGTVIQDANEWWRKNLLAGNGIAAFAKVNHTKTSDIEQGIYWCGGVNLGFRVPQSALDQFDSGKPWTVVPNDGGDVGGHSVWLVGYDGTFFVLVTWGQLQRASYEFVAKYADEAWVYMTRAWLNSVTQQTPAGLDIAALNADWTSLTGAPSPFSPLPPQPPAPTPTPTPVPPGPAPSDDALGALLVKWHEHHWHHLRDNEDAVVVAWLRTNGYL